MITDDISEYPKVPRLLGIPDIPPIKLSGITKRSVVRVPIIMQLENRECGAACLSMICAYFGKDVPLDQSRKDCGVGRNGISAGNIVRAARSYGLEAKGYTLKTSALKERKAFPCILHWNMKHYVVLCGFIGDDAIIINPAKGRMRISPGDLEKSFSGICIEFTPTENFERSKQRYRLLEFAKKYLKGLAPAACIIVSIMVINSLFGFIDPYLKKVFLDEVLPGLTGLTEFITAVSIIAILEIIITLFSTLYRLHLSGKLAKRASFGFMDRLLKLPTGYYDMRRPTELMDRLSKNTSISMSIVDILAPLVIQSGMMIFYLFVMMRESLVLTAIGVITVICNLCASRYIAARRLEYSKQMINDTSRLSSATVTGIEMAEMIRATGSMDGYLDRWAGYQASMNTARVRFMRIDQYLSAIPAYLSVAANYIVMISGVYLTIKGDFTLGMMSAFLGYLSAFMMPADSLLDMGQTITTARADIDRIEDVTEHEPDPYVVGEVRADAGNAAVGDADDAAVGTKLSGQASMRGVTFSYEKNDDPVVKDIDIEITPGKRIAVVGHSGCGKTTLVRLLAGLYIPDQGEITYDGLGIGQISHTDFTDSVAIVDQDIRLYDDSIEENIRMWDESISRGMVRQAARDAMIHDDIMKLHGRYESRIAEGGSNFSGGQRERLDIARALCHEPSILILDEATGGLDAECEKDVLDAIKRRGIACIMVSHRLSAIKDFDEIIVMDKGRIIERGTYEDLMAAGGQLKKLVGNDD